MDQLVQLALMTRCRKVFEEPKTFLSFPMTPSSFPQDRLKFAVDGSSTPALLRAAREFAQLANSVPRGTLFQPDAEEFLWEVYGDVLGRARVAAGALTPEQQQQRASAMALLYVPTPDGLRQESPQVKAYKQYREIWFKANQDLRDKESSATSSNDAATLKQWHEVDEPALRAAIAQAETDWLGLGFKAEVEAAQRTLDMFARNAPLVQWADWKKSYNPDIDVLTDPENMSFAITGFTPNNIFDQGDWNKMSLDRGQIAALAEEAPAELKRMFQPLPTASPIENVSFEYRSVGIVRPWFDSAVFRARFWRMDDSPPLSDGATPPRGRCPNYITAMVFARNIMVTSRAAPGTSKERPQLVFVSNKMVMTKVQPGSIKTAVVTGKAGPATGGKSAPPAKPTVARKKLNAAAMERLSRASFQSISHRAPAAAHQAAAALALQAAATATMQAVRVARPGGVQVRPSAPVVRDHRARPAPPVVVRSPPGGRPAPPHPPPKPPPPLPPVTTAATTPGTISVLALICRPLPPSPNPDPAFDWAGT